MLGLVMVVFGLVPGVDMVLPGINEITAMGV